MISNGQGRNSTSCRTTGENRSGTDGMALLLSRKVTVPDLTEDKLKLAVKVTVLPKEAGLGFGAARVKVSANCAEL